MPIDARHQWFLEFAARLRGATLEADPLALGPEPIALAIARLYGIPIPADPKDEGANRLFRERLGLLLDLLPLAACPVCDWPVMCWLGMIQHLHHRHQWPLGDIADFTCKTFGHKEATCL